MSNTNGNMDQVAETIEDDLHAMFSGNIIKRGAALLAAEKTLYGTEHGKSVSRMVAQNYIYAIAGVNYPDKPVTPQIHAAAEMMALALTLLYTSQTPELMAHAVKELGILSKALRNTNGSTVQTGEHMPMSKLLEAASNPAK